MSNLHTRSALVLAVVVMLAAGCGGGTSQSGGAGGDSAGTLIRADGSSTVFPVSEAVAEEFQKTRSGTRVTVGISGTGGGFQKFCRDETDISNASRPIRATEMEACKAAGIEFIELPVAYDGLAVMVNPKNSWTTSMTTAELKKLWSPEAQGKITRWSHIRTGWPDREIHLFGAGVDSGTFDYFTEAIVGKEDASRGDFTSSEDDNTLVQGIAGDELALGFFGYAYYAENKDRLKLVAIDDGNQENGAGAILPSPESVRNGTYRPLSRPIFIYVKRQAVDRPEIQAFVNFFLSEGLPLVREVGYVPLTDREYELVRTRFGSRVTGTMFHEKMTQSGTSMEAILSGSGQGQ